MHKPAESPEIAPHPLHSRPMKTQQAILAPSLPLPSGPGGPGSVRAVSTGLSRDMTGTHSPRGRDGARPSLQPL